MTMTVQQFLNVAKLEGADDRPQTLMGKRIEIPVHYDMWIRGARHGEITGFRHARDGYSAYLLIKMDHPQIRRRLKLWQIDWDYARIMPEFGNERVFPEGFGFKEGE